MNSINRGPDKEFGRLQFTPKTAASFQPRPYSSSQSEFGNVNAQDPGDLIQPGDGRASCD
jgi:hypothetical protein